jgi:PKD repeat protein
LIIVNTDSNDELTQSLPTTTDSDFNEISNLGPNTTIIYVLFAGNSSFEYEEEVFEDLANQIISLFPENTNSSSNENKGTIEPSETSTIDVTFYSGNLNEGTYNDTIFIQSNDPLNSLYEVPVLINIDETLCDLEIIPNIDACSGFVNFVPTFFNEATTYNWDFGDGNTSTLSAPVHFYENTGLFDVTLTISNEISSLSESIQLSINQNNGPKSACEVLGNTNFPNNEIMHFQLGDIDNETANTTGVFHDFSCTQSTTLVQGETYPYLIEIEFGFNDNAMILIDYNNNGTFEEVEVIVNGNSGNSEFITGNYVVPDNIPLDIPLRLRVISDPNNSFSPCETSFGEGEDYTVIFISNEQPPIVDFETSAIDPCEGILQFIDQSIFSPHTYLWDFGDGNTSTIMDPIHTYDSSGIFTVSLTATNDFGTQTVTKQVLSNALKPQINIISQDLEANTPILMEAIGNNVTTWFWQFGNGETSNNQIASTEYDADGPYVVNLTAVNQIGCQRTISQIIYIGTVSNSEIDHSITVYPNPSTQGFYIENLSNKSIKSLRLMNAAGKICKEQHLTSNNSNQEFYVEKGNIPSGFYQLIMEFEDGNTINKKIIFIE